MTYEGPFGQRNFNTATNNSLIIVANTIVIEVSKKNLPIKIQSRFHDYRNIRK